MPVLIMVALVGAARLFTGEALGAVDRTTEATCQAFCQLIPSPAEPCKDFARALPRPKVGRTCARKFGEGWAFACPLICSRLANGEDGYLHLWRDRLTQSSCQEMSGHIPYPAVFNSCKTGYRSGFNAATTAASKQFRRRKRRGESQDPLKNDGGKPAYLQLEDKTEPAAGAVLSSVSAEADALAATSASESGKVLSGGVDAWMETLDTPPEYIDYASVAQERVSAARRARGSDLKRGPACPVCSG